MADLTINGETVITDDDLEKDEEVSQDTVRDNVVGLARDRLEAYVRRAGISVDALTSTNAAELRPLGEAIWLEAYWAQLAKELDVDEGFESKRAYWEAQIDRYNDLILGEPPQLTAISSDRPRGNLRFIKGSV